MKFVLILATLLGVALMMTGAGNPAVSFVGHEKVAASMVKGTTLVSQPDLAVQGAHRAVPGEVELHEKETDVFYVTDGEATVITGGTIVGGKQTAPGQIRGTRIEGGEAHHLTRGDVMVIPAGTPHWFKEVPRSISYFVVKSIR